MISSLVILGSPDQEASETLRSPNFYTLLDLVPFNYQLLFPTLFCFLTLKLKHVKNIPIDALISQRRHLSSLLRSPFLNTFLPPLETDLCLHREPLHTSVPIYQIDTLFTTSISVPDVGLPRANLDLVLFPKGLNEE